MLIVPSATKHPALEEELLLNTLAPFFSQIPVLAALPEDALRHLERAAEQRHYRRRQVIHFPDQPGDFLYVLCQGGVKIGRTSEQGREFTLLLLEGPQLFGETGLFDPDAPYELMAETMEDSLIGVLRRSDMLAALAQSPPATLEMLKLVSERRAWAESQAADLVFLEVPRRIARLLLRLHDTISSKSGRGGLLAKLKLTHQEMANMIGSTRETTTLILNDFKRQGALEFAGRKIVIHDRTRLEAIAQGGAATRK